MNESIHALSGAYAIDAVDDLERARFERHLGDCAECLDEVEGLRAAAAQLGHLATMAPPARLREQVLKDIQSVRPLPPEAPLVTPTREVTLGGTGTGTGSAGVPGGSELETRRSLRETGRRPGRATRWLVAAAAVVAIGGGSGIVYNQVHSNQTQTQVQVADSVLRDSSAVRKSVVIDGGTAELVASPKEKRAVIVTTNVPVAPSGKVYQLWLKRGAAFVSAGLMPSKESQTVLLDGDTSTAQAVGITVEPAGGSPAPTTTPVALIGLA